VPPQPVVAPPPQPLPQDPHAIGQAAGRLGNAGRKAGRTALGVASVLLQEGELAECLVVGRVNELDGACLLTDRRVFILNDRAWLPDQVSFPLDSQLYVQGEAAGKTATLTFHRAGVVVQVAKITDVALAQELAQRVRAKAAAAG
jgi:hypothetical protein